MATDLYRRKVYNSFIIIAFAVSIANHFIFLDGFTSLKLGLLTALLAFCILVPLYIAKMLGGGDLKVFVVLGLSLSIPSMLNTFIFSLLWGLFLGIAMVISKGKAKSFLNNTIGFLTFNKPNQEELNTIPYTVAILLGWLTHISMQGFSFI